MKDRRYILIILVFLMLGLGIYYKYDSYINRRISRELDIAVPNSINFKYVDSHGALGDGILFAKGSFNEKQGEDFMDQIEGQWNKIPLTQDIKTILYGNRNYSSDLGRRLGLPVVNEGYWILIDRHGGNIRESSGGEKILSRSSANYSFAVFDSKSNIFYYLEYDS